MTIANSGTVGSVFFHQYAFVASDHCHVLSLKDDSVVLDEDLFVYLQPVLEAIKQHYNFGREINDRRLRREIIELPVLDDEKPDWEGMRQLARDLRSKVEFNSLASNVDNEGQPRLREGLWKSFPNSQHISRLSEVTVPTQANFWTGEISFRWNYAQEQRSNAFGTTTRRRPGNTQGPMHRIHYEWTRFRRVFLPTCHWKNVLDRRNKYGYHRGLDTWTAAFPLSRLLTSIGQDFLLVGNGAHILANTQNRFPSTSDGELPTGNSSVHICNFCHTEINSKPTLRNHRHLN